MLSQLVDTTQERYVIFSTHHNPIALETHLDNINVGYKRLQGLWKGIPELSWIINAQNWPKIYASRWLTGQEAVLHLGKIKSLNNPRPAAVEYRHRGAAPEFIGWLWPVSEEVAKEQTGWTRDGKQYYVAAVEKPE